MCHRLRCVALVALSCAASARPQVCTPHLLGMDRRGPAEAIARSGDLIHLGAGAALHVFDVTTPGAPVELGWANLDRLALDVAAWGNKVVVRDAKGLDFLDVSDRSHPFVAASLEVGPSSEPYTVTTMNDHAWYVADQALHAVEITDPAHPVEVGAYPVALARDVALRGDRAYLLTTESLHVLDVSDPAAPFEIASVDTGGERRIAIAPSGNRLAIWTDPCDSPSCFVWVRFFSLADPDLPSFRSELVFEGSGRVTDVAFGGGRAFVALGTGVAIYDLSDLAHPVRVGTAPAEDAGQVVVAADPAFLWVADRVRGLSVYDVAPPGGAHEVARVPRREALTDAYLHGPVLVASSGRGVRTFDLTDPARPVELGSLGLASADVRHALGIGEHGYLASASTPDSDIRLIDLHDPAEPVEVGSIPWFYNRPSLDSDLLAVRETCAEAVALYDVSDPAAPLPASRIHLSDDCAGLEFAAVSGRLYVRDPSGEGLQGPAQLRIYDVTDPTSPVVLAVTESPIEEGIPVGRGRTLYVAGQTRLEVLDASVPSLPVVLATRPLVASQTPSTQRRITLYGSRLMVPSFVDQLGVAHPWPIQVFDVTSPSSPLEIAVLQTPGGGRVAAPGPGLVVVADGPAGISVYESCVPFADGFESGDAAAWSDTRP